MKMSPRLIENYALLSSAADKLPKNGSCRFFPPLLLCYSVYIIS